MDEARNKAIANAEFFYSKYGLTLDIKQKPCKPSTLLYGAFVFSDTDEGIEYWKDIFSQLEAKGL